MDANLKNEEDPRIRELYDLKIEKYIKDGWVDAPSSLMESTTEHTSIWYCWAAAAAISIILSLCAISITWNIASISADASRQVKNITLIMMAVGIFGGGILFFLRNFFRKSFKPAIAFAFLSVMVFYANLLMIDVSSKEQVAKTKIEMEQQLRHEQKEQMKKSPEAVAYKG